MRWKHLTKSLAGSKHLKFNVPCQDYSDTCVYNDTIIILCADGAGSATRSAEGAKKVCKTLKKLIKKHIRQHLQNLSLSRKTISYWLEECIAEVKTMARMANTEEKEYYCTILGTIATADYAVFFQLGDGGIVYSEDGGQNYIKVFDSQKGEYENQTIFLTSSTYTAFLFEAINKKITNLALFTDGIENLVIDMKTNTPHQPFFDFIFKPLKTKRPDRIRNEFGTFLGSSLLNSKTDDDKTLAIALRK